MNKLLLYKREITSLIWFLFASQIIALGQGKSLGLDPKVRTGKLPNGFTYYIRHNTEPKNRAVFYLANKVGSILETDDQQGLAHFLEHMSFNGTKHFPKNQLVNYLQRAGVRFGADINAYTNFDETVYELPLSTSDPELIKNGLQILRDWAQEATLDADEIDKERGIVLEEKRLRKGAKDRMQQQYWPMLTNGSRYAYRLAIGTEEVLKTFKPQTIREFYKDWYRPNLQAIIIVGDIDVETMERDVKTKFSDLKNPLNEKVRIKYAMGLAGKNQFMAVTDHETTATVLQVIIKRSSEELKTADDYQMAMTNSLINIMLAERYQELARKQDPDFLQANANFAPLLGGLSAYTLTLVAKPGKGDLEKGLKAVWRETFRVKKSGFTQVELSRAKSIYQTRIEAAYKERDKTSSESYVKEYLQYFLHDNAAPGISAEFELVKNLMPKITLDKLNSLVGSYISDTNRDILIMAPMKNKVELPGESTVKEWITSVESESLKLYREQTNSKTLLARKPVKGLIVAERKEEKMNITTLTLSNGVKVILKPTTFKSNEIIFNGLAPGGTSLYSDDDFQSAANASGLVASFGVGNFNASDLGRFLVGKQVNVRTNLSERNQTVVGASAPQDLGLALELLYGYFTEPRKDSSQFESMIARSRGLLINRGLDPSMVFQDTIAAVLSNYNLRRTGPNLEKLDQINLDRAHEIYRERFGDASGFTFTFVGNFSTDSIKPLIEQYLGALPSTQHLVKAKDLEIRIPNGKITKKVYRGTEQKAMVQLIFSGAIEYKLSSNIDLNILKEALNIRLLERLREEEGGVYSISIKTTSFKYPEPSYTFAISFGCAPSNVDKLTLSALDEVNKLKTEGPLQINLDKAIIEERKGHEKAIQTNGYWLGYLTSCIQNEEEFSSVSAFNSILDKVRIDTIKVAAQKYINGSNLIKLILLPEVPESD